MRVFMGKKKDPVFSGGELTFQITESAILDFVPVIRVSCVVLRISAIRQPPSYYL